MVGSVFEVIRTVSQLSVTLNYGSDVPNKDQPGREHGLVGTGIKKPKNIAGTVIQLCYCKKKV
jgi:hypothetical protein